MPILGIVASSNYQRVAPDTGAMFPLGMVQVGSGGASTVTFSSIPSTYTHLQIRALLRGTNSSTEVETRVRFNSDTASNYSYHQVYGQGSNVPADGLANSSSIYFVYSTAANATASIFSAGIMDILDYKNTNKYKTTRALAGFDANGSGFALFRSGNWRNTNAITSIDIYCDSGNFAQYSSFALYGIK